ncbi:MAG: hypothetical protein EXS36_16250 [Pedosphaera sp.]|nr:hypothetical protein [Pedosphaera sp.]
MEPRYHVRSQTSRLDPKNERARTVVLMVGILLVVVAGVAARPAWRALWAWRVHRLVVRAEDLIGTGDWQHASRKASAALVLESNNPEALRSAARAQALGERPVAIPLWIAYLATGRATSAERRTFIQLAIRFGAFDVAPAELLRMLPGNWNDAERLFYGAQLAAAFHDFDESLHYVDLAEQFGPTNLQSRLFGANLRSQSPNAVERQHARSTLFDLISLTSGMGIQAIEILARNSELSAPDRSRLLQELGKHPLGGAWRTSARIGSVHCSVPAPRPPVGDSRNCVANVGQQGRYQSCGLRVMVERSAVV